MSFTFLTRTLIASIAPWLVMVSLTGWPFAARAETTDAPVSLGTLRNPDGQHIDLAAPADGLTVLVFYSSECPISNAYSPTLGSLIAAFPAKPVKWVGVCVDPDLSDADLKAHARDFNLKFPVVRDRHGAFARKIGATMTPEAFVDRRQGASALPRQDRRSVREAWGSQRQSFGQRAQGRDHGPAQGRRGEGGSRRSRRLPDTRVQGRRGCAHVQQGSGPDPSAELPGMPPQGPGGAVRPGYLRAGAETGRGHRRRGRGPVNAPLESRAERGPEVQARPLALRVGHRHPRVLGGSWSSRGRPRRPACAP